MHILQCLFAGQGDGLSLHHLLVECREVVQHGDGDAPDQVVEGGNGPHRDDDIVVDRNAVEQLRNRLHRVSAAVVQSAAVGICQSQLTKCAARSLTRHAQHRDLCHRVAV